MTGASFAHRRELVIDLCFAATFAWAASPYTATLYLAMKLVSWAVKLDYLRPASPSISPDDQSALATGRAVYHVIGRLVEHRGFTGPAVINRHTSYTQRGDARIRITIETVASEATVS